MPSRGVQTRSETRAAAERNARFLRPRSSQSSQASDAAAQTELEERRTALKTRYSQLQEYFAAVEEEHERELQRALRQLQASKEKHAARLAERISELEAQLEQADRVKSGLWTEAATVYKFANREIGSPNAASETCREEAAAWNAACERMVLETERLLKMNAALAPEDEVRNATLAAEVQVDVVRVTLQAELDKLKETYRLHCAAEALPSSEG